MLFPFETLRVHKRRRVNFVVNMAHPVTEAFFVRNTERILYCETDNASVT